MCAPRESHSLGSLQRAYYRFCIFPLGPPRTPPKEFCPCLMGPKCQFLFADLRVCLVFVFGEIQKVPFRLPGGLIRQRQISHPHHFFVHEQLHHTISYRTMYPAEKCLRRTATIPYTGKMKVESCRASLAPPIFLLVVYTCGGAAKAAWGACVRSFLWPMAAIWL